MAIQFAITGEGKKLVTYGEKSCRVMLRVGDTITIVRSKGPRRLIVDDKYEDNAGQAEIDGRLAKWELGYVCQRLYKSFVAMTPADKLQLIEKIAFNSVDVDGMRSKCKRLIAERKDQLVDASRQRKAIENVLGELGVDRIMEMETKETLEMLLHETKQKVIAERAALATKNRLTISINQLNSTQYDEPVDIDCDVDDLIAKTNAYARYDAERNELNNLMRSGNVPSGMNDLDLMITETKEMIKLERDVADYNKTKTELNILSDYKRSHAVLLTCPVCRTGLGLRGRDLTISDDTVQCVTYEEINECETKALTLSLKLAEMAVKVQRLDELSGCYTDANSLRERLVLLETAKRSDAEHARLVRSVAALKCEKPDRDAKSVVAVLERNQRLKTTRALGEKRLVELSTQLYAVKDASEDRLIDLENRVDELERRLKSLSLQDQFKRIDELTLIERAAERKLPVAVRLSCLMKSAERAALDETIARVNSLTKTYTSAFFPLADVCATLSFETDKIAMAITFDENECDVSSLSGGEFARIVLAFAISLAQINAVPVLLLDESLASLDADTSDSVMSALRDNYGGKVIVIAHQTTKGVFDQIKEL